MNISEVCGIEECQAYLRFILFHVRLPRGMHHDGGGQFILEVKKRGLYRLWPLVTIWKLEACG